MATSPKWKVNSVPSVGVGQLGTITQSLYDYVTNPKKVSDKNPDPQTPKTDEIKSLLSTFIIQIHWLKIFTYTLQHLKPLSPSCKEIHREKSQRPYIAYPHPEKTTTCMTPDTMYKSRNHPQEDNKDMLRRNYEILNTLKYARYS